MELGLLLEMAAGNDPDRVAVTDARGSLTLGELHAAARRAAARFDRAGVRQVGYLGTNGLALPVALFGAALAGRPFVPLNYRWSDAQLAQVIGDGDGLTVVVSADEADRLRSIDQRELIDSADLLSDRSDADVALPAVDAEGIAVLLYTSGTTSAPKAAILRHRHLSAYIIGTVEFGSAATDDAVLVSVPPYHIAGISSVLSNLYSGRRIVYLDPFEPGRWLSLVRDEGVTHAMVVPTMLARIVDELGDEQADVPTLQSLAYGGALMPLPVIEQALQRFPDVRFTNAYGLTETSSTITLLGPEDHRAAIASDDPEVRARLRSAGRPLPGVELLVADPEGRACPPAWSARSWSGVSRCRASTSGSTPTRPGGSPPGTAAPWTPRASCSSRADPTTRSSGGARTSRRRRSRRPSCAILRSRTARWSASPTPSGASASPPP